MFSNRSWVPQAGAPSDAAPGGSARSNDGSGVIDLTQTNPTAPGLALALDAASTEAAWPSVYEPDSFGSRSARAAICEHLNADPLRLAGSGELLPEQLVLTASTSEAYGYLFKLLCDPGDVVLVPRPGYPLFDELARCEGVNLRHYPLRYDGAWFIDGAALRSSIDHRVRAVVVISPNNPTGSCLRHDELEQLLRLDIPLICDEVFAPYLVERRRPGITSMLAAGSRGLTFVLDGLSKRAALPQVKLAWIAVQGEPKLRAAALRRLEFIADAYLSVNGMVQQQTRALLELSKRRRDQVARRVVTNLRRLDALLFETEVTHLDWEGGWSAVLRLPDVCSEDAWLSRFEDAGVRVQPGWFYDFEFGPLCVISLLERPERFERAISRLVKVVASGGEAAAW